MDVYLLNVIRPTRLVTPIMQAQKSGAIVNISTAWAFEPSAMFPTSAVARAGLAAFSKLFADTYAPENIRMNNVLPGWIDSLPVTEERRAATIAFLASDGAGYITGQNIRVDGAPSVLPDISPASAEIGYSTRGAYEVGGCRK
eukprot:gene53929-73780_t